MGVVDTNGAEVRGSACGFTDTGDKVKVKESERRFVAEGGIGKSTSGIKETTAPELIGKETGESDGVSVPTSHFRRMCKGDGL